MKNELKNLQSEFLSYLKDERGFSPNTIKSYENDLKIFVEFCSSFFQQKKIITPVFLVNHSEPKKKKIHEDLTQL